MKDFQVFTQPDIGDLSQFHIRLDDDSVIRSGRQGRPYLIKHMGCIRSDLPVFLEDKFRLHIGEGQFYHRGAWDWAQYGNKYAMLKENCHLTGEGRWTELILQHPVLMTGGKKRPDAHMLSVGSDYVNADGASVSDLSLITSNAIQDDVLITSGIRGYGSDIRIRNVHISGLRGSAKPVGDQNIAYEAFGISFGHAGGHIVSDCRVSGENYFSAFSAGDIGTKFVDCKAVSDAGYAGFTVYNFTKVIDCSAGEFAYGVYNDTNDAEDVQIERSMLRVSRVGVGIVSVAPHCYKRNIRVRDCDFFHNGKEPWVGLELIDKTPDKSAEFQNFEFVGCGFTSTAPLTLFSTDAKAGSVRGIRFIDCMFQDNVKLRPNGNEIEIIRPRRLNGMIREEQIPQVL